MQQEKLTFQKTKWEIRIISVSCDSDTENNDVRDLKGESQQLEDDAAMVLSLSAAVRLLARLKMAVWYPSERESFVAAVLRRANVPAVLNAVERPRIRGLETRVECEVVVVVGGVNVSQVLRETLWNGNTRFLVVAEGREGIEGDFREFWRFKVINIFELLREGEGVSVYGFLPYQGGDCGETKAEVVDEFELRSGNFSNNGDALKDPMRIKDLNGCRVNVTVVDVKPNVMFHEEGCDTEGIEGNLMTEVARRMNFSAAFVVALDGIGWGWIYPSPHGAVGEVFTGRSDFAIGLLAPTLERFESLDLSVPYNGEECITYGVPTGAGASTPSWITILISEFNPINWILIFLSFVAVVVVLLVMRRFSPVRWVRRQTDVVLFAFSSCLGLPVKVPRYLALRLSVLFWVMFSFVVTVAYKSSMGSKLAVPSKNPDINTFQELLDSNLQLTGYNNMLRLIQYNDKEPILQKMIDEFKVTNFDIDFAVDRIAAERKIAYVRHTTTFLYYAFINPKAKGHIHIIKDCVYLYHPMIVAKRHSPFTNKLNQLIIRMMESGITKKWRSDYIMSFPPPETPFLKLSNDHMYGVFCILASGYVLGLMALVGEVIHFRIKRRSQI